MKIFSSARAANATALLALVVALGGTGYAAVSLPKNSVGSPQIKKNAVKSSDVKDGALRVSDFKAGQLPQGPQGPTGPQGLAGSARAYGFVDVDPVTGNFVLRAGSSKGVVAIGQGSGGNSAACIQLAPSINAGTAVTVATANFRTGGTVAFNTQVEVANPLGYCVGVLSNVVEVLTTQVDSPGAAVKRAFAFAVM